MESHAYRQAEFAVRELWEAGQGVELRRTRRSFGQKEIEFQSRPDDEISALILDAFIPVLEARLPARSPLAEIVVVRSEDSDFSMQMARAVDRGFPIGPTPFRFKRVVLHADLANGITVAWNRDSRSAVVHLRPLPELDPRALITPLRVLMAWIAEVIDGEIVHAAALERSGNAVALAGSSGSGKSTLARALADRGWIPLADDAVLVADSRVFPLYTRAKWAEWAGTPGQSLGRGKPFVELTPLPGHASGVELSHIVFPRIVGPRAIRRLTPAEASFLLSATSLPEILGGTEGSQSRLDEMAHRAANWRVNLEADSAGNAEYLTSVLGW